MSAARFGTEIPIVDGLAEPLLRIGQQNGEGRSFGVFEFDSDGVTALRYPDVGDDGGCTQLVTTPSESGPAGGYHVC